MDNRFRNFTDDELYVLHRHAIKSSVEIVCTGKYDEICKTLHCNLINEIIDEMRNREAGQTKKM